MGGSVGLHFVGMRWERKQYWGQIGSSKLQTELLKLGNICWQHRVDKRADPKRRSMEFQVGDEVLLRVSATKGVVRFNIKGKLSPRYIRPFKILARMGKLAYRLELPESMKGVHNVFYISMLWKYFRDPE
jgi:hypothetical protein